MSKPKINERSVIERCIQRSKYILTAQSVQHTRKDDDFFLKRMPTSTLVSMKHLPELDKELLVLIDGWKRDVANFLRPLFHASNIEIDDKFWFSTHELKDGYVLLSSKSMVQYGIHDFVLLLSNVDSNKLLAGQIITWIQFREVMDLIEGVVDDKSFVTHYMLHKIHKNAQTNQSR